MRFPQPRDRGRGAFSNRRNGGKEGGGQSVPPHRIVAQRRLQLGDLQGPQPSAELPGHHIPQLKDRPGPPSSGEGADLLPPGPTG